MCQRNVKITNYALSLHKSTSETSLHILVIIMKIGIWRRVDPHLVSFGHVHECLGARTWMNTASRFTCQHNLVIVNKSSIRKAIRGACLFGERVQPWHRCGEFARGVAVACTLVVVDWWEHHDSIFEKPYGRYLFRLEKYSRWKNNIKLYSNKSLTMDKSWHNGNTQKWHNNKAIYMHLINDSRLHT